MAGSVCGVGILRAGQGEVRMGGMLGKGKAPAGFLNLVVMRTLRKVGGRKNLVGGRSEEEEVEQGELEAEFEEVEFEGGEVEFEGGEFEEEDF